MGADAPPLSDVSIGFFSPKGGAALGKDGVTDDGAGNTALEPEGNVEEASDVLSFALDFSMGNFGLAGFSVTTVVL